VVGGGVVHGGRGGGAGGVRDGCQTGWVVGVARRLSRVEWNGVEGVRRSSGAGVAKWFVR